MSTEASTESLSTAERVLLVLVPLVGGSLLLALFEDRTVHELGLFLLAAGGIGVLVLLVSHGDRW
jgi:hypothetical protein